MFKEVIIDGLSMMDGSINIGISHNGHINNVCIVRYRPIQADNLNCRSTKYCDSSKYCDTSKYRDTSKYCDTIKILF